MIAAESTSAVQNASGNEIGSPAQGTAEEKSTSTPAVCKDDPDASTSSSTSTSIYYQHSTTNATPHATPTTEGEAAKDDGVPVPLVPLDNSTRICTRELLSYSLKHSKGSIKYYDVINYLRSSKVAKSTCRTCVMCGVPDGHQGCSIPTQNKDVCKVCDKGFWYCKPAQVVVKFCKGCKNFTPLALFDDKPDASKCAGCRDRGRQNYFSRKVVDTPPPASRGVADKGGAWEVEDGGVGATPSGSPAVRLYGATKVSPKGAAAGKASKASKGSSKQGTPVRVGNQYSNKNRGHGWSSINKKTGPGVRGPNKKQTKSSLKLDELGNPLPLPPKRKYNMDKRGKNKENMALDILGQLKKTVIAVPSTTDMAALLADIDYGEFAEPTASSAPSPSTELAHIHESSYEPTLALARAVTMHAANARGEVTASSVHVHAHPNIHSASLPSGLDDILTGMCEQDGGSGGSGDGKSSSGSGLYGGEHEHGQIRKRARLAGTGTVASGLVDGAGCPDPAVLPSLPLAHVVCSSSSSSGTSTARGSRGSSSGSSSMNSSASNSSSSSSCSSSSGSSSSSFSSSSSSRSRGSRSSSRSGSSSSSSSSSSCSRDDGAGFISGGTSGEFSGCERWGEERSDDGARPSFVQSSVSSAKQRTQSMCEADTNLSRGPVASSENTVLTASAASASTPLSPTDGCALRPAQHSRTMSEGSLLSLAGIASNLFLPSPKEFASPIKGGTGGVLDMIVIEAAAAAGAAAAADGVVPASVTAPTSAQKSSGTSAAPQGLSISVRATPMCATRSRSLAGTPRGTPRVSTPTLDLLSQVAAASAAKERPAAAAVLAAKHTAITPPPLAFFSDARPMTVQEAGLESPVFYRAKAAEGSASDACTGAGVLSSIPASPMSPLKGLALLG